MVEEIYLSCEGVSELVNQSHFYKFTDLQVHSYSLVYKI